MESQENLPNRICSGAHPRIQHVTYSALCSSNSQFPSATACHFYLAAQRLLIDLMKSSENTKWNWIVSSQCNEAWWCFHFTWNNSFCCSLQLLYLHPSFLRRTQTYWLIWKANLKNIYNAYSKTASPFGHNGLVPGESLLASLPFHQNKFCPSDPLQALLKTGSLICPFL